MSIWKSPIFYLGIILMLVIAAALLAPFVVNWNGYRDNLESYGRKLTGREVAINGPISVRLFPWPRLVAEDVSLSNPAGFVGPAMMNARSINVELALAGLFDGEIRVETISINHPVINVVRLADGQGNWIFEPDQALRQSKLLDQVKLDQVKVSDGVIHILEMEHRYSNTITAVNAVLSASALEGPWRVRGTANESGVPLDFTLNSSEWKTGLPFRFGAKIVPQDGALPLFVFDGEQDGGVLTGTIKLEPVVTGDGKQSLEGSFKPLQMQTDIKASFGNVALDKIHIVPADSKDSGTLIEGSANLAMGDGFKAVLNLNSPRLDLDSLAGSQSLRVWRAGGIMAVLNDIMKEFPQKLDLAANFQVAALSAVGENVENVNIKAIAEQNAIRIQDFTANLPGRSRMKFNGIVFPGDQTAELGGSLAFESNDTRQFVGWLWPEGKAQMTKLWTGNRGRLKAQSDVSWSGQRFGFQKMKYELDGELGDVDLAVRLGSLPAVDLQLRAKSFDLDNYLKTEIITAANFLPMLQSDNGFEKRFIVQADRFSMNGVEARDVAVDYVSSLSGFEIKTFRLGSIEGANMSGSGLVLQGPDGPTGDLKIVVKADNPRGLLQLLGFTQAGNPQPWTELLGISDVHAGLSIKPGSEQPEIAYDIIGQSGPLIISASGDVRDLNSGANAKIGFSSEISSHDGADLLRLFGLRSNITGAGAGRVVVTAVGSPATEFKTAIAADLLGGKIGYDGQLKVGDKLPQLNGKLFVGAADGRLIGQALGLPIENASAGELKISSEVLTTDGVLNFGKIFARVAGQNVSGEASLAPDGQVKADFTTESLNLKNILPSVFMAWRGQLPKIDDRFSEPATYPATGEIWLRPATLSNGLGTDLKEGVVGISFDKLGRSLTVAARSADGEPFKAEITVKPDASGFAVSASGHVGLQLDDNLKLQNGNAIARGAIVLDGAFKGEGRSPLASFSSLSGNGTYELRDAALANISVRDFFARLQQVKDVGAMKNVFDSLLQPPGTDIKTSQHAFASINGTLTFQQIIVKTEDADLNVEPSFDLPAGTLTTVVTIAPQNKTDLPSMRITYSGEPSSLTVRSDTSALASKLGYAMVARDVAELDRLQKQQAKILAEGEAQRKADEEKFAAFQAQRGELRLRQRELRVHAAQRVIDAAQKKAELDRILAEAAAINKNEMAKFQRALELH
jgi:AsmA family/AsmA-like C-terminal region